jgi:hypothetical protein
MQKTEIVCGLPWLQSKPERAIFVELGFACVYAVGPVAGRPLRISWGRQLKDTLAELQPGCWKPLQVHDVVWTAGDMLAVRLLNEATALLDKAKRRLTGDWYDVTPRVRTANPALRHRQERRSDVHPCRYARQGEGSPQVADRCRSQERLNRSRHFDSVVKRGPAVDPHRDAGHDVESDDEIANVAKPAAATHPFLCVFLDADRAGR